MGQLKRMMEEIDDAQSEAESLDISAGWLERCERHDEVFLAIQMSAAMPMRLRTGA
ncbi:hypothetical protein V7799_01115 [Rhizobium laguerreae]